MAQALLVFRQAIGGRYRQRATPRPSMCAESEVAPENGSKRATQNFEHEVNDIVQALDAASKTMDRLCADHGGSRRAQ